VQAHFRRGEDELIDKILDDVPIGGRVGDEKIELVEKI
jgi:hypothetical protein